MLLVHFGGSDAHSVGAAARVAADAFLDFGTRGRGNRTWFAVKPYASEEIHLLEGPVNHGEDLETNLAAVYPLALQIGRPISAKPVSAAEYEEVDCPLYRNARREGIAV